MYSVCVCQNKICIHIDSPYLYFPFLHLLHEFEWEPKGRMGDWVWLYCQPTCLFIQHPKRLKMPAPLHKALMAQMLWGYYCQSKCNDICFLFLIPIAAGCLWAMCQIFRPKFRMMDGFGDDDVVGCGRSATVLRKHFHFGGFLQGSI